MSDDRNSPEENLACHLCGAQPLIPIGRFEELIQVTSDCRPWRAGASIAICAKCGTTQKPVTARWKQSAREIYDSYDIYVQGAGAEQRVFDPASGRSEPRSRRLVSRLIATAKLPTVGRLLDIGCGNGALLKAFSEAMPGWRMTGLELGERHRCEVLQIPGVEAFHAGTVETLDDEFDLITMVHCLEHISQPAAFLETVKRRLRPAGTLFVEVPNAEVNPFDLLIADHCTHFTGETLRNILQAAGYQVLCASSEWVMRELSVVARPDQRGASRPKRDPSAGNLRAMAEASARQGHWLEQLLFASRRVKPVAVFGTSIAATWLAANLGDAVEFFVEEDPSRIGRRHMGKPILSPQSANDGVVLLPFLPEIADAIARRLSDTRLKLVLPPAMPMPPGPPAAN